MRITDHADEEAFDDSLTYEEIYFSVIQGEVIEDYPDDKPYPSCLVMGKIFSGEPIHSVWAYNPENQWVVYCLRSKIPHYIHNNQFTFSMLQNVKSAFFSVNSILIAVYRPDPERWIDWKVRVKK